MQNVIKANAEICCAQIGINRKGLCFLKLSIRCRCIWAEIVKMINGSIRHRQYLSILLN